MESEHETPLEKGDVPNFGQISQQFDPSWRSCSCSFQRSISINEFLGKKVWKPELKVFRLRLFWDTQLENNP